MLAGPCLNGWTADEDVLFLLVTTMPRQITLTFIPVNSFALGRKPSDKLGFNPRGTVDQLIAMVAEEFEVPIHSKFRFYSEFRDLDTSGFNEDGPSQEPAIGSSEPEHDGTAWTAVDVHGRLVELHEELQKSDDVVTFDFGKVEVTRSSVNLQVIIPSTIIVYQTFNRI